LETLGRNTHLKKTGWGGFGAEKRAATDTNTKLGLGNFDLKKERDLKKPI